MHPEQIPLQDRKTPQLLFDWARTVGNGEIASGLRSELMVRGFTPSELAQRRVHASTQSAAQRPAFIFYLYFHRYVETGLNWIWVFIQLGLAMLALASLGDLIFFSAQYGSKSAEYLQYYWTLLLLFTAVAVLPRVLLIKFPLLAVPYVVLALFTIQTLSWCIANSGLALADSSPIFRGVRPLVYFLAADAACMLLYWLAARAVQAREASRLNDFSN